MSVNAGIPAYLQKKINKILSGGNVNASPNVAAAATEGGGVGTADRSDNNNVAKAPPSSDDLISALRGLS